MSWQIHFWFQSGEALLHWAVSWTLGTVRQAWVALQASCPFWGSILGKGDDLTAGSKESQCPLNETFLWPYNVPKSSSVLTPTPLAMQIGCEGEIFEIPKRTNFPSTFKNLRNTRVLWVIGGRVRWKEAQICIRTGPGQVVSKLSSVPNFYVCLEANTFVFLMQVDDICHKNNGWISWLWSACREYHEEGPVGAWELPSNI